MKERSQKKFFFSIFNFIFFPFWQNLGSAESEKRKINEQWPNQNIGNNNMLIFKNLLFCDCHDKWKGVPLIKKKSQKNCPLKGLLNGEL